MLPKMKCDSKCNGISHTDNLVLFSIPVTWDHTKMQK